MSGSSRQSPSHGIEISVIVPNYNGRAFLPACLDSLERQTHPSFEILVVENGSTDGSLAYLEQRKGIRLLNLKRNLGFSGGCNAGIRAARGRFLALFNNDAVARPDWLARLAAAAARHPDADSFASLVLRRDRPDLVDSAGDLYSIGGSAKKRGEGCSWASLSFREEPVFGASACAAFYRRRFFETVGGFDEDFFCYFEDADLSFRAALLGLRCIFVPDAVVYHAVSATKGERSPFVTYHNNRNLEWVYLKNMPAPLMIKYALPTAALRLAALLYWAGQGQLGTFLRAKRDAWKHLARTLRKRRIIQSRRALPVKELDRLLEKRWIQAHLCGRNPFRRTRIP